VCYLKSSIARSSWLLNYFLALAFIVLLNFVLPRMMPGDPFLAIYGDEALVSMSPEMKADIIRRFQLDLSWQDQLTAYLSCLLRGDLGYSYYYKDQVLHVILGFLPWTLLLVGLSLVISSSIAIMLGVESGYRHGSRFDCTLLSGLMLLSGFPSFFIGIMLLLVFGVMLGIMPLGGAMTAYSGKTGLALAADVLHHLALPLFSLALWQLSPYFLLTRNAMLSNLRANFVLASRARGCTERSVKYRHAGRNSLLPVVTAMGTRVTHLLTSVIFIETIFSYPGVGSLLNTALSTRDYPLIQGVMLLIALAVLTMNFLVDLIYSRLDPRVRYAH